MNRATPQIRLFTDWSGGLRPECPVSLQRPLLKSGVFPLEFCGDTELHIKPHTHTEPSIAHASGAAVQRLAKLFKILRGRMCFVWFGVLLWEGCGRPIRVLSKSRCLVGLEVSRPECPVSPQRPILRTGKPLNGCMCCCVVLCVVLRRSWATHARSK